MKMSSCLQHDISVLTFHKMIKKSFGKK